MASLLLKRAFLPNPTSKTFLSQTTRNISTNASASTTPFRVTLFPGEGIGPEITASVKEVFKAAEVPIEWEEHTVGKEIDPKTRSLITWESLESVRRNGVGLKGPMDGPYGIPRCRKSNFAFRNELDIYANVRLFNGLHGCESRYKDANLVIIHETAKCVKPEQEEDTQIGNQERIEEEKPQNDRGEYVFEEAYITQRSMRVAECAFQYAKTHGLERISALHAANMVKMVDDIFLECCRNVAKTYPEIMYMEIDTDTCCNMLVIDPSKFDVLVMPNYHGFPLNGFIDKHLARSLLSPSYNIGEGGVALAEIKYGAAPDIAGKNVANPTELLLSAIMILRHLKLDDKADQIQIAITKTIATGKYPILDLNDRADLIPSPVSTKYRTAEFGGSSTTTEFTRDICDSL